MRGKQSQLVRSGGREAVVIVIVVILAVVVAFMVVVAVEFIHNKKTTLHLPEYRFYTVVIVMRVVQYIPRNMHTVFALLCFVVVIHWLIFPYPSCLLHLHCGNLTIAPVPAKQPWSIWINTSCEFIMNDCITTTKQSTTKPCAYFLGYTVVCVVVVLVLMVRAISYDTL